MNIFKNVAKVATGVLLISVLSGCTGSSPWVNIPYQEANSWRGIGVSAYAARNFRKNGFTPYDIKPWIQVGIRNPNQITNWNKNGFSPKEASKWLSKDIRLDEAIKFKKKGLTVD